MNRLAIFAMFFSLLPLNALEVRLNGDYFASYNRESLTELSYKLPSGDEKGLFLRELLPLMDDVRNFRLFTGEYMMETDPTGDLRIVVSEDLLYLKGEGIGSLLLPDIIEVEGSGREGKSLLVWFDEKDSHMEREISLFARLHHLEPVFRIEKNIISLLEYNSFNEREIPDLLVYREEKANRMAPLLQNGNGSGPTPYKMSRTLFLNGSSHGQDKKLAADFGDLNLFFSLALHFGMEGNISTADPSVRRTFEYLKTLKNEGLHRVSANPSEDFTSGRVDSFLGMSTIIPKLPGRSFGGEEKTLPHLEGEPLSPLLQHVYLARPHKSPNSRTSEDLTSYLTGYGVQQRIDPETGYLPVNSDVYPLLKESSAKEILLTDLDKAVRLPSGDLTDKWRFVLARISRLVIGGRLTVDEGLAEIERYITE